MGFWQGVNEGLTYVLDKREARQSEEKQLAYDREKFERTLFENNRGIATQLALERGKEKKALEKKLAYGMSLGLSETTASALLSSGQLDNFLTRYEKNDKIDPSFVTNLNTYVEGKINDDETLTKALLAGVDTNRDVSSEGQSELAILESVLSATSQEDLDKLSPVLYGESTSVAAIPRFDVNFSGLSGPESSETAAMRREIAGGLSTYFKDSFTPTDTGELVISQSAEPAVRNLFNEAERAARRIAFGPRSSMSPTDASAYVVSQIETAMRASKGVTADAILNNFSYVLNDPMGFAKEFNALPQPEPVTLDAGTAVEDLGDTNTFGFNVDEFGRRTQ
jgi:hypothetical protein